MPLGTSFFGCFGDVCLGSIDEGHQLLAGDGFLHQQVFGDFVQQCPVVHQGLLGIGIALVQQLLPTEYMFLYTADGYEGEIGVCKEGTLEWVKKKDMYSLNLWEGDKIFLKLLEEGYPFFSLKLSYEGDKLVNASLDGKCIKNLTNQ